MDHIETQTRVRMCFYSATLRQTQIEPVATFIRLWYVARVHSYQSPQTTLACNTRYTRLPCSRKSQPLHEYFEKPGALLQCFQFYYNVCNIMHPASSRDCRFRKELVKSPVLRSVVCSTIFTSYL